MAGFQITKVIKEYVHIKEDENGGSYGEALDSVMNRTAIEGEIIQTVTFQMEETEWFKFAKGIVDRISQDTYVGETDGLDYPKATKAKAAKNY